ncbi:ABC transporter ATP-binding protein [Paenibacillus endoradicis]|uniref:ABC transporter ATP-binding protein n=1 Tax=Paenibacillus endoradicis TaxID=2972487 RepID=UPI0021599215|nr:ABC transporter ATP-binding protein [Paenibacillus endoradicis]MCR8656791.1 ABC transporter ATP-binding protein [Paenibacillus endoradicis]
MQKILEVNNLAVSFDTYAGEVQAVRGVTFHLNSQETLAIVGESGSGKSVTVQTIMKLLPNPPARIKNGTINYNGKELTKLTDKQMERIRGKEISMIFQDPMTSLNPTMKVGDQIIEGIKKHEKINQSDAVARALEMLTMVGIPSPKENMARYPHQFSGGMRQRVMIAIALACNSNVLLADEPTTALDVTMQAQILRLMNDLKDNLGTAIVLITHDMGVVAQMADRIAVMYGGKIVETGTAEDIFYNPQHPYTWGLLQSMPSHSKPRGGRLSVIPGTPPDMLTPPKGCAFAARCLYCMNICKEVDPELTLIVGEHQSACWLQDPSAPKVDRPKLDHAARQLGGM